MRQSSFRLIWPLLGAVSVAGCELSEPASPQGPEPEETVVESEGDTEVVVTPVADEPAPEPQATEPPVSPREGVHETGEQTRGRLGKDKISAVLDAHSAEFTQCYASALKNDQALAGRVTLLIVISPQGKVAHAHVVPETTTLEDAALHKCLVDEAQSLRFDKPVGGRVVTQYPLDFKPTPVGASHDTEGGATLGESAAEASPSGEANQ
jgi:hypothetical protein